MRPKHCRTFYLTRKTRFGENLTLLLYWTRTILSFPARCGIEPVPESSGPLLHTPANSAPSSCPLHTLSADSPSLRTAVPPVAGKGAAVGTCKPHPGLVMISCADYRSFIVGSRGSSSVLGISLVVLARKKVVLKIFIWTQMPCFYETHWCFFCHEKLFTHGESRDTELLHVCGLIFPVSSSVRIVLNWLTRIKSYFPQELALFTTATLGVCKDSASF